MVATALKVTLARTDSEEMPRLKRGRRGSSGMGTPEVLRWQRTAHCQRAFHTDHTPPTLETNTTDLKRGLYASPRGSSAYLGTYTRLQDRTVLEEFRVIRITPTISLAANLGEALNKGKATQSIQQCAGTDPKGCQKIYNVRG